jgi:hypothetical protein
MLDSVMSYLECVSMHSLTLLVYLQLLSLAAAAKNYAITFVESQSDSAIDRLLRLDDASFQKLSFW